MSKLYFECRFKSYKLSILDLPIEIRKLNLAIVARSRLSQSIELKPGTYYVSARLPGGQELYNHVQVVEDSDTLVVLTPDSEDVPTNEIDEMRYFLGGQQDNTLQIDQSELLNRDDDNTVLQSTKRIAARLRAFIDRLLFFIKRTRQAESVTARLRVFRYNIFQNNYETSSVDDLVSMSEEQPHIVQGTKSSRWLSWRSKPSLDERQQVIQLYISGVNGVQLMQLLQPKVPPINIALPVSMWHKCLLVLTRLPNGLCSFETHLANTSADLLLRYMQKGYLEQSAVLTASKQLLSELMLNLKLEDPIAATVAAYALLRFGDLESLEDCTRNLNNQFEWLPDGVAIRGEYLARLGDHDRALKVLLNWPSRELPIFSYGLSYAINRLKYYIRLGEAHFEKAKLVQAQVILEQLQEFAMCVDFRQPLLTFTGLDPRKPNDEPLEEDVASYDGLNIGTLFRPRLSLYKRLKALTRNIATVNVIASIVAYFKAYRVSFLATGIIMPIVASAITIVFYLLPSLSLLPLLPPRWYALLYGILVTCILWLVVAARCSSFATAKGANPRSYALLISRLRRLKTRLGISDISDNPTLEEMLRAAKVDPDGGYNMTALREGYAYCANAWRKIRESGSGLQWILGIGYINAWIMLHRAEEALIEVDPAASVIRGAIHSKVRFQDSVIGNRTQLLRILRLAVTDIDTSVKFDGLATMDGTDKKPVTSDTSVTSAQAAGRAASRVARNILNNYRDSLWKELLRIRNQLLVLIAINGFFTYILLCIAILIGNPTVIIVTTLFYIIGSITGLIRPLYKMLRRRTTIEDYGFSWVYIIANCSFSGLASVFGLLIMGRLYFLNEPTIDLLLVWQSIFRSDQLLNLLIVLISSLVSNLYFNRIWQKEGKLESDLESSNPSYEGLLPIT